MYEPDLIIILRGLRDEIHDDIKRTYRPSSFKDVANSKRRDILNDRLRALDDIFVKLSLGIPLYKE